MNTRLKEIIEAKDISRKQIAKDLGIERRTLDNYINGVTQMNAELIVKMAIYLKVPTDYLLGVHPIASSFLMEKIDKIASDLKEVVFYLIQQKK